MFPTARPVRRLPKLFAAIAFASVAISGFADPAADVLDETDVRVQAVVTTQDEVTPSLMQRPEILGTAVGIDEVGNPILKVYGDREAADVEEAVRSLPHEVRGTPVQVELMDEVRAMVRQDKHHLFRWEPRAVGRTISRTATAAAVLLAVSYASGLHTIF
jgi:hypothetical protein